jgi:hypothetical protein
MVFDRVFRIVGKTLKMTKRTEDSDAKDLHLLKALSNIVRDPAIPMSIQNPTEKLLAYRLIGKWIKKITPRGLNIGDVLRHVGPLAGPLDGKGTPLSDKLYSNLHRPLAINQEGVYNKFFGTVNPPTRLPSITDRDIVESIFLQRPNATTEPHDTNAFFGWFANYFTHLFLWTSPEDPTQKQMPGFSSTGIYGNTDREVLDLRTGHKGKVHLENAFAPTLDYLDHVNGRTPPKNRKNVFAGRNNTHVGLPVVHTLVLREHNRVCDVLSTVYPQYTDEDLFQIARDATMNTVLHIVRTEYISTFDKNQPLVSGSTMGPNLLTLRVLQMLTAGKSLISAEYLLVYAWHSAVHEKILIEGNPREIVTEKWFRDPLGAIDNTFSTRGEGFDDLMAYAVTTPIPSGLNVIRGTPRFLASAEEGLMRIQRANRVVSYNEARRQLGLRPYTDLRDLVRGTVLKVSEMKRLFQSVENVDLYTGIRIDNTKVTSLLSDVPLAVIGSLAFGLVPLIHGTLQAKIPPCLQAEVEASKKNGFLSTLLRHHVPAFVNIPTIRTFCVVDK